MLANDVLNSGAIPTLEAILRFSGARQRILQHNVANMTTPNFIPRDVSVSGFQEQLAKAIEKRNADTGGMNGAMELPATQEVEQRADGSYQLTPSQDPDGILFHDRNNRDVERLMQDGVENLGVYRIASELLRSRMSALRDAIGERV